MQLNRPSMIRALLVPALVLVLGVGAIASIVELQAQARHSQQARLTLARTQTALIELRTAPFSATAALGGSPAIARGLMYQGERQVNDSIAVLSRSSPPLPLRRLARPLRELYATLQRIYVIGATTGFDKNTPRLAVLSGRQTAQLVSQINLAGRVYDERSATADRRATIGSAVVILLLVAGFAVLYRRATKARMTAEGLAVANGRLLDASRVEALTDALTTLPNRRALSRRLEQLFGADGVGQDHVLALFDLDGFKQYNDTFGHPAGDALLARLGTRLAVAVHGRGTAYRIGGDEFCVLAPIRQDGDTTLVQVAADALSEAGEGFDIGCSLGSARIRGEAATAEEALRLADHRMYEHKVGRTSPGRQSSEVLLKVLSERSPNLHEHLVNVADLAEAVSRRYGLAELDVQWVRLAAELHDVGKVAIPDAILNKPGPLSDAEWAFMQRHTTIGERIIRSATSLAPAAALVRSSHERYDGKGYPDGLYADETEVGASIIAICDAYDAMISKRVYREAKSPEAAIAELRRCSGTQFDPVLVEMFCAAIAERDQELAGGGPAAATAPEPALLHAGGQAT